MAKRRRKRLTPGRIIGLQNRIDPQETLARFRERDARMALDTRNEIQRWLNDPPPDRSALHQVGTAGSAGRSASGTRVDMWRKPRWPGHTL